MIMFQLHIMQNISMAKYGSLMLLSSTKHTGAKEETAPPKRTALAPETKRFGFVLVVDTENSIQA